MRLLIDTHCLIWFVGGDKSMPGNVRSLIVAGANEVFVSAASIWETAIKVRLGKLPGAVALLADLDAVMRANRFSALDIGFAHARRAAELPLVHKDPFDRMLASQALVEQMPLVSSDSIFDSYGVTRLW